MKRREFVSRAGISCVGFALASGGFQKVCAAPQPASQLLSDPTLQPKFVNLVPDALSPAFIYKPNAMGAYAVDVGTSIQWTGLMLNGVKAMTPVWGYGDHTDQVFTWPGRTFQIKNRISGGGFATRVTWGNKLNGITQHMMPVDTSIHWAYAGTPYTIAGNGVPIVPHLHGGHTDYQYDGNAEYWFTPNQAISGPGWMNAPGGAFNNNYVYDNNVPAGTIWYHDHALGITHLNVYAGLAGFYIIRDMRDTGKSNNVLGLPAWPYEKAYAIQDRMFLETGELFLPAFPGDPAYADFIDPINNPDIIPPVPSPTILTEFFGDHMVVNGLIWPKENVEPRNYRMRLLNGCDSRTLAVRFMVASSPTATDLNGATGPLQFQVIGADQGLAFKPTTTNTLLVEPGARYDIIFDFKGHRGQRIIMQNIGGDMPFMGMLDSLNWPKMYGETDRIMAFDVADKPNVVTKAWYTTSSYLPVIFPPERRRKVGLFEGRDNFGRIWPHQGTAEPATDMNGSPINYPNDPMFSDMGLVGQINGSCSWHYPTTENPKLGATEHWEIWNSTADAHPIHLHLVHFDVVERRQLIWDSAANGDHVLLAADGVTPVPPNNDGAYLVPKMVVMHDGSMGKGYEFARIDLARGPVFKVDPSNYIENAPRDEVICLPSVITTIQAYFDKYGDYLWHCHILSHEEHEMMRRLWVGDMPAMIMKPAAGKAAPSEFSLAQNYPNPFNPSTTISFQLPANEKVELKIFNNIGQEVRTLANARFDAGVHHVVWDGKSNGGQAVASGMYIYKIKAGNFAMTRKMSLLR
jgi:spore coat protein A, manganese oxidase